MKKYISIFIISISCLLLTFSATFAKEPSDELQTKKLAKEDVFSDLELFADAMVLISANYVKDVESREMIYGALDGMLLSLDSHSSFLRPEDFKELRTDTKGEFGGLGIKITLRDKVLTVVSPLEGTPAYEAGILPKDRVIKIGDESTKDFTLDDAVKRLRGLPGSKVKLTILREGEDELKEFELKRAIIKIKSVKDALVLRRGIGYIRIADFQQNTPRDFDKALSKLIKKRIRGLILDLRNNPGGLLSSSVAVAEKFLKRGDMIVSTRGRIKQQEGQFKSRSFKPHSKFPIAVLQNKGSASASEIVAGALRDNKRALIVGEKSFGKGSVQTVIPLNDGSALRLTTSYYYTPSGAIIHEKGISPDIESDILDEDSKITKEELRKLSVKNRLLKDGQVLAALEIIQDQKRYTGILSGNEDIKE